MLKCQGATLMCIMQVTEGSRSHTSKNNNSLPFHDKSVQDSQFIAKTPMWMQVLWNILQALCQPVMMTSGSSTKVESAFISSCRDLSRVSSTFRTCAMLMSKPGIYLVHC